MFRRLWMIAQRRPGPSGQMGLSVLIAGVLLAAFLLWVNHQFRPVLEALAVTQISNEVTAAVNNAVSTGLAERAVSYDDMVSIETDADGRATVLKSNMAQVNLLRTVLLSAALEQVAGLSERSFSIPIGNLLGMDFFSGRGPGVKLEVLSTGAASAEFHNEFTSAGVNQTLHQIILEVDVTVQILIPGERLETVVATQVCVAETVIVGQVPDTYLQLERGA